MSKVRFCSKDLLYLLLLLLRLMAYVFILFIREELKNG